VGHLSNWRAALLEAGGGLSGQEHPAGRQVTRRVPGAQVAEVDHPTEVAVCCQQIRRVQVCVQPQGRACPDGRGKRIILDLADGARIGNQPAAGGLLQEVREAVVIPASGPPRPSRPAGAPSGAG